MQVINAGQCISTPVAHVGLSKPLAPYEKSYNEPGKNYFPLIALFPTLVPNSLPPPSAAGKGKVMVDTLERTDE